MAIPQAYAPQLVVNCSKKAFAGASIKEVYKIESKVGKNYFEIEYILKGNEREVKVDPSEKIM